MSNNFIDISEHNTILSYGAIGDSNLKGVIIKATEGTTFTDHAIEVNYESLRGKVPIGFYHYLTSTSSPITQAQNFWEHIKNKEYEILPILDVEQPSLGVQAESYSEQFTQEFFKLSGQEMIIYSGRCYIEEHFSDEFKRNHVWWVADYSAQETPSINECDIIAWQFTEDCQSYAFAMGDLDCSLLIDESKFYIEKYVPPSEGTENKSRTLILNLQSELNAQGFRDYNGNKLIVDGFAGVCTLSACPIVKQGATGNITRWLQGKLGVFTDGIFGKATRQAIINFQQNNGLLEDGVVGKNTWTKLLGL